MVLSGTVPKEFNFNTNSRTVTKATSSSSDAQKEVDFIHQLRKPSSHAKALRGATVPKPFNLSTGTKREADEPAAYVPMAQQIERYLKQTPERYHLRSRKSRDGGPSAVKGDKLKLTQPHTPHLMTRQRSRPTTVKSTAELEEEEAERLHNCSARKRRTSFSQQGLPEKKVLNPTVPESPAFLLKKRVRLDAKVKQPLPIKAPPVPHFGLPFQPQLQENHHVEVPLFRAQPLPDFDTVVLPEKKKLEPTKPEPFKLR
ncbi:hypothetical protein FQN60_002158 [Etheostoma spectabile]|uniref:TPX2 central domain-containing protein n=1 Tax=Etheostoma spectabile TaxID=54343 RepID=A0A5J5DDC2_9PERO|nr:hypothetical protein FQN60_002158 [Etheostoma spectabile]